MPIHLTCLNPLLSAYRCHRRGHLLKTVRLHGCWRRRWLVHYNWACYQVSILAWAGTVALLARFVLWLKVLTTLSIDVRIDDYLSPVFGHQAACQARHGSIRNFAIREVAARKDRGSDHDDILAKLFTVHRQKPQELDETAVASVGVRSLKRKSAS